MPPLDWDDIVEGWFWLPAANPRKVRGVLKTSWANGIELSLEEHLFKDNKSRQRIYGSDMAGRPLVLLDAFTRNQTYATSLPERFWHILTVNEVFLGTGRPKTRFPRVVVRLSALSDFLTETAISIESKPPQATWKPPRKRLLHAGGLTIQFEHRLNFTGGYRHAQMKDDLRVELRSSRGRQAPDWLEAIDVVAVFVGFCVRQPAGLERISLIDHQGQEAEYRYRLRSFNGPDTGRTGRWWLREKDFGDELGPALDRWHAYRKASPEAFDMISEYVAFGGDLNSADRLLLLARFLEVHHRRTRKGGQLTKKAHSSRTQAILANAPLEHRAWLKDALAFSNNLKLYERLVEICNLFGRDLDALLAGDREGFARRVTDTRNYYTHYSSGLRKRAAREIDLVILTKRLWFVVRGCILLELGFSPQLAVEALKLDSGWAWLCRQPPS